MEINHRTLAPLHCASTDKTRDNVNVIHFDVSGDTIATNGHIMAHYVPSGTDGGAGVLPFSLSLDSVAALNKEQRKRTQAPSELEIDATNANGHARISNTTPGTIEIPKAVSTFPDWRAVMPTSADTDHEVGISLAVLEPLIAAARQFSETRKGEGKCVKFRFPADSIGTILATVDDVDSGDKLEIVLMPMRIE